MPINVSEALDADTAVMVVIQTRTGAGYGTDGIFVPGVPTSIKTLASVQQPDGAEMKRLPEGQRDEDTRKFISKKKLKTVNDRDQIEADRVIHKGVTYEIIKAGDWDDYGHTTAFGARVK